MVCLIPCPSGNWEWKVAQEENLVVPNKTALFLSLYYLPCKLHHWPSHQLTQLTGNKYTRCTIYNNQPCHPYALTFYGFFFLLQSWKLTDAITIALKDCFSLLLTVKDDLYIMAWPYLLPVQHSACVIGSCNKRRKKRLWSSPLDWLGQFVACKNFHSLGQTLELHHRENIVDNGYWHSRNMTYCRTYYSCYLPGVKSWYGL